MDDIVSFGTWLKQRRRSLSLTQAQLARQVGCATVTLQKIELDERRPSIDIAERLAEMLQIAPEERPAFLKSARGELAADRLATSSGAEPAPPWRAKSRPANNLPMPLTPLIGREQEMVTVGALLQRDDVRLLSMTGPGGVGKSRLAIAVATDLLDGFTHGAWFVDLAPISDPAVIPSAIAQVLGVKETTGQPLLDTLTAYLRDKHLLLLLDNFEQALPAAPAVAALLQVAPRLCVLVTSRAPLRLRGEREFPVPTLTLPDTLHLPPLDQLLQYEAVALFIARAQDVKPDFQVTNATAPAVAEICVRLDGLPLAIELAAARVKLFPAQALLARLDHRLRLLTGGARDLTARQQTLRGAIDWSYQLLTAADQSVFARLGVFVGGCTLEAAEAVCTAEGDLNVLDAVASLVDKSLLQQVVGVEGEPRFRMLETLREYALERLETSGGAEVLRQQHAQYYVEVAETAEPALRGPDQLLWLDRLEAEHDNLRAALAWSVVQRDAELGLRLVGALAWFWLKRGYFEESDRWLQSVLDQVDGALKAANQATIHTLQSRKAKALLGRTFLDAQIPDPPKVLARGMESLVLSRGAEDAWGIAASLAVIGRMEWWGVSVPEQVARGGPWQEESLALARQTGDPWLIAYVLLMVGGARHLTQGLRVIPSLEESLVLAREAGDAWLIAAALFDLGFVLCEGGDYPRAAPLFEESLGLARELGDKLYSARALYGLELVLLAQGQYATARPLTEEHLALEQHMGNRNGIATARMMQGWIALAQDDYAQAVACFEGDLALRRQTEDTAGVAAALSNLGDVARFQHDYGRAETLYTESLALFRDTGNQRDVAWALHKLGYIAQAHGNPERAATLFQQSLALQWQAENRDGITEALAGLAWVAVKQGEAERAARLLGTVEVLRTGSAGLMWPWPTGRIDYERTLAAVLAQLDEATFAAAHTKGQAMTLEQAIPYALEAATDA